MTVIGPYGPSPSALRKVTRSNAHTCQFSSGLDDNAVH